MLSITTTHHENACEHQRNHVHDEVLALAFLRASRRPGSAIVAVNQRVVMTTARAASFVDVVDLAWLQRCANAHASGAELPHNERAPLGARCAAVTDGRLFAGVLVDFDPAPEPVAAGDEIAFELVLPGESRAIRDVRTQLGTLAGQSINVLIAGAAGTGKMVAARTLLGLDGRTTSEFDCAESTTAGWLAAVTDGLRRRPGVVLGHLDETDHSVVSALAAALEAAGPTCRVVATTSDEDMDCEVARAFAAQVTLPALQDRPEDLPDIAAAVLARQSLRGHTPRLGPDARRLLWSYPWPGNAAELELVLRRAVQLAPTTVIDESCIRLPHRGRTHVTRRRTAVMAAERDAVVEALERCDGNKLAAADLLGIARSTLYRKLRALAIA